MVQFNLDYPVFVPGLYQLHDVALADPVVDKYESVGDPGLGIGDLSVHRYLQVADAQSGAVDGVVGDSLGQYLLNR